MTDNNESGLTNVFPSIMDTGTQIDIDAVRAEIANVITEASAINEDTENEIAFDLAECIAECTIVNEDCERCICGLIDHEINQVNEIIQWFDTRVRNAVDRDVSEAVGILMSLGVPIQDLFPSPGTPIQSPEDDRVRPGGGEFTGNDESLPVPPPILPVVPPATPQSPAVDNPPQVPQQQLPPFDVFAQNGFCLNGNPQNMLFWINQSTDNLRILDNGLPNWRDQLYDAYAQGRPLTIFVNGTSVYSSFDGTCPQVVTSPGGGGTCPATVTVTVSVNGGPTTTVAPPLPPSLIGTPLCDPNRAEETLSRLDNLSLTGGEPASVYFKRLFNSVISPGTGEISWTRFLTAPVEAVGYVVGSIVSAVAGNIITVAGGGGILGESCRGEAFSLVSAQAALANFAGGWLGIVPPAIRTNNEYTQNLLCQYLIPSGPEANSLRSRGLITEPQWRLLVHANGLCEPWQEIIVDGMASVPTIDETNRAFKANYISEETYYDYMRRNGVTSSTDIKTFARLGEFIPGPSDLVRFMVRDAFNDDVARVGGLDNGFTTNFKGRAKEWAAAQGMDENQFKYFWRAHWDWPSNTALYEMLHRLRDDTPIPGSNSTAKAVTVEQIRKVLEINDMAPEWVDRLLAISYRPLTRVDARRAFELGDLDREGLRKAFLDLGNSPENADILVRFSETSSGPIRAKKLGYASTSEVLGWYRDAVISRDVAWDKLRQSGVPDQNIERYLDTEDSRVTAKNRRSVLKAIQGRFNKGEFSAAQVNQALVEAGIDPSRIGEITHQWGVLRDSRYKAPTVKMLCDWWSQGIMTIQEYERRLVNLGYSLVDAARIMQTCQNQERERLEKEAEKFAKEAQQRQDREDRKRKAAQREAERLAEKLRPCKPPPKPPCPSPGQSLNGQG